MPARTEQRYVTNSQGAPELVDNYYALTAAQYNIQSQAYLPPVTRGTVFSQAQTSYPIDNLTQAFGNTNFHGSSNIGRAGTQSHSAVNGINVGLVNGQANQQVYYVLPDGRYYVPQNVQMSQGGYQNGTGAYNYNPSQAQFLQQAGYQVNQALPNTPTHSWMSSRHTSAELPELSVPRRNSYSSNEDNGPHTPFYGANAQTESQPKVSVTGYSPHQWTTLSPESNSQTCYPTILKTATGGYAEMDLDVLCQQNPAIPRPIPAIFSGEKGRGTLDKSLINQMNTTNVYIRGLLPDTTDDMLKNYGGRFGDIISAKSMVDQHTQLCKGFGFIKYHNFVDGENCIRGFFHWGYEAKWARVSHNEKLKNLGDPENTNLYVSNLPADLNEAGLDAIFIGYQVLSKKVLRDPQGLSRGVGFARFATPEICETVIEQFSDTPIGDKGLKLNIRYADTEDQKKLKTVTAERRQFKTNEYNTVAYGPGSPYAMHSPLLAGFPSPLHPQIPGANGFWPPQSPVSPMHPTHSPVNAVFRTQTMPSTPGHKQVSENIGPIPRRQNSRVKIESPKAYAKRALEKTNELDPLFDFDDPIPYSQKISDTSSKASTKSSPCKSSK
ncbi:hypothetical protein MMC14_002420 [Varicellaria rhodocarpa]|nr:hypothetical protein [Varicellaria rhodocarpa]